MTSKERMLAALRGEPADRAAWAPFLAYWWETGAPEHVRKKGMPHFMRSAGADVLLRGFTCPHKKRYNQTIVSHETTGNPDVRTTRFRTPVGELIAESRFSPAGDTWFLTGHPVKTEADLKTLAFIARDSILEPSYDDYETLQAENPDALIVPNLAPEGKSSFQSLLEYWIGTEELCYMLADMPEAVEDTLSAMQALSLQAARIAAASTAEVFLSWEDTSTTNLSPAWYEKYVLPEINQWCDILHGAGKLYIQHACGHLRALAPLIAGSRIDGIESVSAPPTGDITPWELAALLPPHMAMISGIEPTFFMNATIPALEAHVEFLCRTFAGKRFILANADSCPPSVSIDKFAAVARATKEHGV